MLYYVKRMCKFWPAYLPVCKFEDRANGRYAVHGLESTAKKGGNMKRSSRPLIILSVFLVICLMPVLAGCGMLVRDDPQITIDEPEALIISDIAQLENGGYYICHDGIYNKLYVQHASYNVSKSSSQSNAHTLWYSDDWQYIPTMYRGDTLVFKSADTFNETFTIERFNYVGYTVGVTKLKQLSSGRYSFSTKPDEMNINPASNATQLYEIPTETGIIDQIGGADLRAGNISPGGCILGLEKGKTYLAEVYAGTYLYEYKLTADSIALTSSEVYNTTDYKFLKSQLIEIHIPEHFNSGYYMINGYGLVRYVNGTSYDADTDFNIPNPKPQGQNGDGQADTPERIGLYITGDGEYKINFMYEGGNGAIPSVTVIDEATYMVYKLDTDPEKANALTRTMSLHAGEYTVNISGLYGRRYLYDIENVTPKESASASAEEETAPTADSPAEATSSGNLF